jgi:hypothetical protein
MDQLHQARDPLHLRLTQLITTHTRAPDLLCMGRALAGAEAQGHCAAKFCVEQESNM